MSDPEEIKTVTVKLSGQRLRIQYDESSDGIISNLRSPDILAPAIINGRECTRDRTYTKASFDKYFKNIVGSENE